MFCATCKFTPAIIFRCRYLPFAICAFLILLDVINTQLSRFGIQTGRLGSISASGTEMRTASSESLNGALLWHTVRIMRMHAVTLPLDLGFKTFYHGKVDSKIYTLGSETHLNDVRCCAAVAAAWAERSSSSAHHKLWMIKVFKNDGNANETRCMLGANCSWSDSARCTLPPLLP